MSRVTVVLMTALLTTATMAPLAGQHHGHQVVTGGGAFPAGWAARPDSGGKLESVKFVPMGNDYHLISGTSTVLYRQVDHGNGPLHAVATFAQTKSSGKHPEGYGLFYGGKELEGAGQQYIYFLVRGDGKYLIKRRTGTKVISIKPWTAHPAIKSVDGKGPSTNLVEIEAKPNATQVVFRTNGQAVDSMTVTADDLNGIVGIRANHDLDLHIIGFAAHRSQR